MDTSPRPDPSRTPVSAEPAPAKQPRGDLKITAALLYSSIEQHRSRCETRIADLDLLIREAETREHRRAAYIARDRDAYRLGGAFEPLDGFGLDDIQLTGFLALGTVGVLMLAKEALAHPSFSIVELLTRLFLSKAGRIIRAHGVYVRWQWLAKLYIAETERFQNSEKGQDPLQTWRSANPTTNQTYLVVEICRFLQIKQPTLADCGAAHDWISRMGGNPRFIEGPPPIDLAALEAAIR